MKKYVKEMVEEHSQLYVRLTKLNDDIYNKDTSHINKADFANMCMQLAAMRQYEKCLIARLNNAGVSFTDGAYHECVAVIAAPQGNDDDNDDAEENQEDNE
jgi:hypothetical protein